MVRMSRNSISWPFLILILVAAADISMLLTSPSPPPLVSMGVALDFMIVLPLLVFWICMRRMSNAKLAAFARALAVALAGYAAARLFVPIHGAELRLALDSAALGAGIGLAAYALYYAARLRATCRQSRSGGASPVDSIRFAFAETASSEKLGRLLAHEASSATMPSSAGGKSRMRRSMPPPSPRRSSPACWSSLSAPFICSSWKESACIFSFTYGLRRRHGSYRYPTYTLSSSLSRTTA